jgi:hypothetical protein
MVRKTEACMNLIIKVIREIIENSGRDVLNTKEESTQTYDTLSFFKLKYIRAKDGPKTKYVAIPYFLSLKIPKFNFSIAKLSDGWQRIDISNVDDVLQLSDLVQEIYDYCELKITGELFDCCSKYDECSSVKECLQKEEKWHKGCTYRVNLTEGKIFYGANSSIKK